MKIILDTHILLWWLCNSPKLSEENRVAIASPKNLLYVSVVSVWEVEIKRGLSKIVLPLAWTEQIERGGFRLLSITLEHILQLRNLPAIHRDPFDRLLVAQTQMEGAQLLTQDATVLRYL